MTYRYK